MIVDFSLKYLNDIKMLCCEIIMIVWVLLKFGLIKGMFGNVSVCIVEGFLIILFGIFYDQFSEDKIVKFDMNGCYCGDILFFFEWCMYLNFYLVKLDCGVVVYCYSLWVIVFFCYWKGILVFYYMVVLVGGDWIDCVCYESFGIWVLFEVMIDVFGECIVCFLVNYGQIVGGINFKKVFGVVEGVEDLVDQYLLFFVFGEFVLLDGEEMVEILLKFKSYGKQVKDFSDGQVLVFELLKWVEQKMCLGIDWGGIKIEIIVLLDVGDELFCKWVDILKNDYDGCLQVVKYFVEVVEIEMGQIGIFGFGIFGLLLLKMGFVKNVNFIWMNGKLFDQDLEVLFGWFVWIQNDVNCFVVFEVIDGVGVGGYIVYVIIIGIGFGLGIVIDGKVYFGVNGIGGEWGGIVLFWIKVEEFFGLDSWIGYKGVIDMWCLGMGF